MKRGIRCLAIIMSLICFMLFPDPLTGQGPVGVVQTEYVTVDVDGRAYGGFPKPVDRFTIVDIQGNIEWLKVVEGQTQMSAKDDWEQAHYILYDNIPVRGYTVICPKGPPPCEGCGWQYVSSVSFVAIGKGSITLAFKTMGYPPYPTEGNFLDEITSDDEPQSQGIMTVTPAYIQPGTTVDIEIRLSDLHKRHVGELILYIPTGPMNNAGVTPAEEVRLPPNTTGEYHYFWTPPEEILGTSTNPQDRYPVRFEAYSSRSNANGGNNLLTRGSFLLNIDMTLAVRLSVQGTVVPLESRAEWEDSRDRRVAALIDGGRGPFKSTWYINGEEISSAPLYAEHARTRALENQSILADAGTIRFDVSDANGNNASGTIYMGVQTDLDFEFSVQGHVVESGEKVTWKEGSSELITARITNGRMPMQTQWFVNGEEVMSSTLKSTRHAQFTDNEILEKASSVTLVVTDGNGVQVRKTVYFEDVEEDDPADDVPAVPVGPEPTPPPVLPPTWEPNPTVEWNNRPWLDERVQQCSREYLQNIVFNLENAYVRWENTALPEGKQRPLWTSIDDWGRILNQYMSTSGGVDGNWDNPTHFVWSEYDKPSADSRYGRTVEYYVKYECKLLEPSPEDLTSAIDDLTDDEENSQWDQQTVQDSQNKLNEMLDIARELYRQFLANYNKFLDEINDQRTNPTQNEVVAFTLASAQNQFDDHSVNKDSLDVLGSALLGQSTTNDDIKLTDIIGVLSEVQVQSDDMTNKLAEMKDLIAAYGGDLDEIMQNGQQIAQNNADPEFVQDGGVNVELFGDGMDNFGDGLQDYLYGNVRRGNVLIIVDDVGNVDDDIFEVSIDGTGRLGETPPGGRQHFDISLNPGQYRITVRGLYSNPGDPNCTYGIQVYDQDNLIVEDAAIVYVNEEAYYYITVR